MPGLLGVFSRIIGSPVMLWLLARRMLYAKPSRNMVDMYGLNGLPIVRSSQGDRYVHGQSYESGFVRNQGIG
jgi:hypothetical protein